MLIKSVYEQPAIKQSSPPLAKRDLQNTFLPLSFFLPNWKRARKGAAASTLQISALLSRQSIASPLSSIHWTLNDTLYERNERFYSLCHTDKPNKNHRSRPMSTKLREARDKIIRSYMLRTRVASRLSRGKSTEPWRAQIAVRQF